MTYHLRRAADDQLGLLLDRPYLIEQFLFGDLEQRMKSTGLSPMLAAKFGFGRIVPPIAWAFVDGDDIMLDKAWHGIHFLLTGSAEPTGGPLSLLLEEWPEIGDVQIGWRPAVAINAAAMSDFNEALEGTAVVDLRGRYDTRRMAAEDVYLADAFDDDREQGFQYLTHWIAGLRIFAAHCVAHHSGAVGYLT
jgi:hypothetical protein